MPFCVWKLLEAPGSEAAEVALEEDRLTARGVQIGPGWWLDYELETGPGWVTTRLLATVMGDGFRRTLDLRPGGDEWVEGAVDCDIAFSPLTNAMPVLRTGLMSREGAEDFVMSWVAVPELTVHASRQRYEHVRDGVVRFVSLDIDYTSELTFDSDGLVVTYPGLGERVA
ncbi:MAG: putative glycolipid-binding domain-containing protein [Thermoleophilaceae bacterium]